MNGLNVGGKYTPSSTIRTEPLTSKYTIQGDIGRGKFAVVRKCVDITTGETVAAKVIRKRRKGKSCREEILREVVMLEYAMAHPRLVSLREVFETPSELILVTEYCSGGELFHECVIEESFEEKDVIHLMVQILEGLCFLHENNIVHLDLKPQNILLTEPFPQGSIKICDLGFACLTNTGEDIRDIIGTPDYVAPEVLDYEPLSIQADMWSLGVLAYVMLTACSPFAGDSQQETFCNISQVKLDFPDDLFSHISPHAEDFIRKLLVKDPRRRMTARQCLDHPWLKAAGAEMHVSLPADNKAAALAQDMVPPSNWNPDRRSSLGKAPPHSPATTGAISDGLIVKDLPKEAASFRDGEEKRPGECMSDASSRPVPSDEVTSTIEGIGIDASCFSVTDTNQMDCSPSNKRQSMEIPLKKARCAPTSPMGETQYSDLKEQEERAGAAVANGGSISVDMSDLTVTPGDGARENSSETPADFDAHQSCEVDCLTQPGV
ncbi:serine/threonine-protein kinase 17B-like [Babylonia areolata]|uniref:serine/threonine-protein kinase 17B-like n=1 Tax=Babylonia areolata TaxID=304850 RepID=UPI003FD5EE2B